MIEICRLLNKNQFLVVQNVKSKNCSLCLEHLSGLGHQINSTRSAYMFYHRKLLLDPIHAKLCDRCNDASLQQLTRETGWHKEANIIDIQTDIKMNFLRVFCKIIQSQWFTHLLKKEQNHQ